MEIRRGPAAALALSLAAVGAATLVPEPGGLPAEGFRAGPFRVADVLRNLILFAPFGASLAWAGTRGRVALLLGLGLSAGVETFQLALVGRYSNLLDIAVNTLGTGVGWVGARTAPQWLHPSAPAARRLGLPVGAVAGTGFLATGLCFAPWVPATELAVHRPPRFREVHAYPGAIRNVWLEGLELPGGLLRDPQGRLHARLRSDFELRVEALVAPAEQGTGALLAVSTAEHEVLRLELEGRTVVLRYLSWARRLGLETARARLPDALDFHVAGDQLDLRVRRAGADLCLTVDGSERCGLGFTVGDGWLLLAPRTPNPGALRTALGALWVGAAFVPMGFFGCAGRRVLAACAPAAAGLVLAPVFTPLLPTPVSQLAAGACGLVLGAGACAAWERRRDDA